MLATAPKKGSRANLGSREAGRPKGEIAKGFPNVRGYTARHDVLRLPLFPQEAQALTERPKAGWVVRKNSHEEGSMAPSGPLTWTCLGPGVILSIPVFPQCLPSKALASNGHTVMTEAPPPPSAAACKCTTSGRCFTLRPLRISKFLLE